MAEWTSVAEGDPVEDGGLIHVDIRGEPVVIARRGGELFAFEGYCTHEECPLADGDLDEDRIVCYCHGSEFYVRTGDVLLGPADEPIAVYPIRVEDGELQVQVP